MADILYVTEAKVFLKDSDGTAVVTYVKGGGSIKIHDGNKGIELSYDQLRTLYCVAPEIMNDLRP